VRHRQPHIFAAWVIDAARTDKNIEQWLKVPDIDLGRMANFSRAVAPIELLGSDVLRYFLMALIVTIRLSPPRQTGQIARFVIACSSIRNFVLAPETCSWKAWR
jgi:hypothetical protein